MEKQIAAGFALIAVLTCLSGILLESHPFIVLIMLILIMLLCISELAASWQRQKNKK